jgi:hypothetical protein
MTRLTLCILAAVLSLPSAAHAFRADNYHEVNPLTDGAFEVISRPGSGAQDFWCAAGDFARSQMGVAANRRIYIAQGRAPAVTKPGYTGVQFTLTPPEAALDRNSRPITLDIDNVGDSLRAAFASQYCYDRFEKRIFP